MMFIFTQPDTNFQNSAGYASGLICETKGKINSSTEKSWVSLLDGVKNQELRFQIRRVVIKDGLGLCSKVVYEEESGNLLIRV
jgi:hypothetical protein